MLFDKKDLPKDILQREKELRREIKRENSILRKMEYAIKGTNRTHQKILRIGAVIAVAGFKLTQLNKLVDFGTTFIDLVRLRKKIDRKHSFPGCIYDPEVEKEVIEFKDEADKRLKEVKHHQQIIAKTRAIINDKLPRLRKEELSTESAINNITMKEINDLVRESIDVIKLIEDIKNKQENPWESHEINSLVTLESCMGLEIKRDEKFIAELDKAIGELKRLQNSSFTDLGAYMRHGKSIDNIRALQATISGSQEQQQLNKTTKDELEELNILRNVFDTHRRNVNSVLEQVFKLAKRELTLEKVTQNTSIIKRLAELFEVQEKIFIESLRQIYSRAIR
ncbi:MAG: hypothetical protein V1866_05265 [archaeon]